MYARQFGELRHSFGINLIFEKINDRVTGKLPGRQADVMQHDEFDFCFWRPRVKVWACAADCRTPPAV